MQVWQCCQPMECAHGWTEEQLQGGASQRWQQLGEPHRSVKASCRAKHARHCPRLTVWQPRALSTA